MTEPVDYRYEYVSGGFPLQKQVGYTIQIFVANRGGTKGIARGYLSISGQPRTLPDLTVFDSGDMDVFPGASASSALVPLLEQDELTCWARIFTTSQNLVPSVQVFQDTTPWIYYAPGDFSEFTIPFHPFPPPPIGPVKPT